MLDTPRLLKESSAGFSSHRIEDEMFENRKIVLLGDINADRANSLIIQMLHLKEKDPYEEITMYVSSNGGEVSAGLAIYDTMMALEAPVNTVCMGRAASMAAVLFVAGGTRSMLQNSELMIHDPLSSNGVGGSALEVHEAADRLMISREKIAKILAAHSQKSVEEIFEMTKKDTWLNAQESLDLGFADKIIEPLAPKARGVRND